MRRVFAASLALVLLSAGAAGAAANAADARPSAAIDRLIDAGRYAEAAGAGRALGGAEGLAAASRAHLAEALAADGVCDPCLDAALDAARRAVAADPHNVAAHVSAAIAFGLHGRRLGVMAAREAGVAEAIAAHVGAALAAAPDNPWALATLGGWHLEVVRHAGPVLGSMLFGADRSAGIAAFHAAIAHDPGSVAIRFNYALGRLALGARDDMAAGLAQLRIVAGKAPQSLLDRLLIARARTLMLLAEARRTAEFADALARAQGYRTAQIAAASGSGGRARPTD